MKTSLKRYSCAASNFIAFFGNFFWNAIVKDCIEVQERKKKVVALCSRLPQKMKAGVFMS